MVNEEKIRIAYLGPDGTFTQKASIALNGDVINPEWVERGKIQSVIDAVAQGEAERGVIPLRTDYADVQQTLDRLLKVLALSEAGKLRKIYITGYGEMTVDFYLAAKPRTKLSDIRILATKQQAIEACEEELETLLSRYACEFLDSTALGAKKVAETDETDNTYATLCSKEAIEGYGLVSLLKGPISKTTRFIRIGKEPYTGMQQDETAIMIRIYEDRAGLLRDIEHEIAPINQTDLYTMKNKQDSTGKIPYGFVIRLAANEKAASFVVNCLKEMAEKEVLYGVQQLPKIDVLGTYPIIRLQ